MISDRMLAAPLPAAAKLGCAGFDKLQNIICESPANQGIDPDYLMKQHDKPELNLV